MLVLNNESLRNYSSFKTNSVAENIYVPESEQELIDLIIRTYKEKKTYRILGNGSNIIFLSNIINDFIIKNTEACKDLYLDEDLVYAGSSLANQAFVKFCIDNGFGGCEYLVSIPGTVGGAIFMNAGRGRNYNQQISDLIFSIKVFDGEKIFFLHFDKAEFEYRSSIFHKKPQWVILGAFFRMPKQTRDIGLNKIQERMKFVQKNQDLVLPNVGSVFKKYDSFIMSFFKGFKLGGTQFSSKTQNWLQNSNNSTALEVRTLITLVYMTHLIFFRNAELEIELW